MVRNAEQARVPSSFARAVFGVVAAVAAVGDVLFINAAAGGSSSAAWAAFFGSYLGLLAVAAGVAALARGAAQIVMAGVAGGGAVAFNVVALLSIGIFFIPLTVCVVLSALRVGRSAGGLARLELGCGLLALLAPLVGLAVLPT